MYLLYGSKEVLILIINFVIVTLSISAIISMNKRGPKTVPCGAPLNIGWSLLIIPIIIHSVTYILFRYMCYFYVLIIYIYIFIHTYFLQSSTQKMQLYTNNTYKKIILLKYMNTMNSDMSEN